MMTLMLNELSEAVDYWVKLAHNHSYDTDEITVYITKSSGKKIMGIMDENQKILDYMKWE